MYRGIELPVPTRIRRSVAPVDTGQWCP